MVLLIDNYDSFSYNLYQMVGVFCKDIQVIRNNELTIAEIEDLNPSHIIISPGPGRPADAGVSKQVVQYFKGKANILGVCLGHQAICEAFGANISYAKELLHGKKSEIHIANGNPIFRGLPPVLEVGRYHSLAAERASLPDELLVIAECNDGELMGIKHRDYEIYGVQFHPESILTPQGEKILQNFIQLGGDFI